MTTNYLAYATQFGMFISPFAPTKHKYKPRICEPKMVPKMFIVEVH